MSDATDLSADRHLTGGRGGPAADSMRRWLGLNALVAVARRRLGRLPVRIRCRSRPSGHRPALRSPRCSSTAGVCGRRCGPVHSSPTRVPALRRGPRSSLPPGTHWRPSPRSGGCGGAGASNSRSRELPTWWPSCSSPGCCPRRSARRSCEHAVPGGSASLAPFRHVVVRLVAWRRAGGGDRRASAPHGVQLAVVDTGPRSRFTVEWRRTANALPSIAPSRGPTPRMCTCST